MKRIALFVLLGCVVAGFAVSDLKGGLEWLSSDQRQGGNFYSDQNIADVLQVSAESVAVLDRMALQTSIVQQYRHLWRNPEVVIQSHYIGNCLLKI